MTSNETIWLFDLGNSRAKGALLQADQLARHFALDWNASDFDADLRARLQTWPSPSRILIASVAAKERATRVQDITLECTNTSIEWLRSPRQACGITNVYQNPEQLGIDRFLALAAVYALAEHCGAVVIGCGTALTLDAIDVNGLQHDGLIAPSPGLMMRSLRGSTAIGETNPAAFDDDHLDDTALSMIAGCNNAAQRLVDWYYRVTRITLGPGEPKLWLHGGWSESLKVLLDQTACHGHMLLLDHAVLRGLAIWARQTSAARA